MNFWDRQVAPRLIGFCCSRPPVARERAKIVPRASGDVLELGCGGGANLDHYDRAKVRTLAGIDPTSLLLEKAQATARDRGFDARFVPGIAEALPYRDDSFDCVLVTFTLCSVDDPARVLAEARRVLRPGGRILYLEHGRAPDPGPEAWQRRLEPTWKAIAGGCHLHRPVSGLFEKQGFALDRREGHYLHGAPKFLGWLESGEARV